MLVTFHVLDKNPVYGGEASIIVEQASGKAQSYLLKNAYVVSVMVEGDFDIEELGEHKAGEKGTRGTIYHIHGNGRDIQRTLMQGNILKIKEVRANPPTFEA